MPGSQHVLAEISRPRCLLPSAMGQMQTSAPAAPPGVVGVKIQV